MKDCCDSCKEGSECCSVNEAQSAYDMMDRGSEILFTKGKMLITKKGVNLFHGRMWSSVNPNGQNVRLTKRDLEKYMGKRGVIKKITDKNNKVVYKESVNEGKWNPNKIKMHTNKAIGYLKQAQKFAKEGQKGAVWQRMGDARDELKIADKFLESVNEAWSTGLERYKVTLENGEEIDVKVKEGKGLEGLEELLKKEGLKFDKITKKASRPTLTSEANTTSIAGKELLNFLMKRFKMSKSQAIASMKKQKMDMSFLKKEGFGGELNDTDKKKFEKAREENAEVLGYELTGKSDVNEGLTKYHIRLTKTSGWYGVWDKNGKQKFEGDRKYVTKELKKLKTRMGNFQIKSLIDVATKRKGSDIPFDVVESVKESGKGSGKKKTVRLKGKWKHNKLPWMRGPAKKESVNEGSFKTTLRPQKKDINKMKVRFKSDPRRVYTLKSVETGRVGGTSYMFAAPGNRKEHFTPKTWDLANKKGWLSLESVKEVSNPTSGIMTGAVQKFSSPEAKIHVDKDLGTMSKHLGKASQQVIKTMMNGVKSGKYDAMDLARGIQTGSIKITHFGERDFIQQLWNKVRDKFRRYSNRGKLR